MSLRFTAFGAKSALFYAAMLAAFLASPYSNSFFLLLAFLTLQWLLCCAWTVRNARGVSVDLEAIEPTPTGRPVELGARARTKRARFKIAVSLAFDGGSGASEERRGWRWWRRGARIEARGEAAFVRGEERVALRCESLPRGVYGVRQAHWSSTYPLGLFRVRRTLAAIGELAVYPAPDGPQEAGGGAPSLADVLEQQGDGPGDLQPSGLRDHRDGDERRAIHWRASARRGSLVVREWEGGGGDGIEVLLDRRCDGETLERALTTLSAVAQVAREGKRVLALYSQDVNERYGPGQRPWGELLYFLAATEPLASDGPAPPTVSPSVKRLPMEAA